MSFIQSTVKCVDCYFEMNVAFGVQGMTLIAQWPDGCVKCGGRIIEISGGWNADNEDWYALPL